MLGVNLEDVEGLSSLLGSVSEYRYVDNLVQFCRFEAPSHLLFYIV